MRVDLQASEPHQAAHSVSEDQHGVTVTVEAVMVCNGEGVGLLCEFKSTDSRNEHKQCGARQVKVGQQSIECLNCVSGTDEQVGVSLKGFDRAVGGGGFECSDDGRTDGDDTVPVVSDLLER